MGTNDDAAPNNLPALQLVKIIKRRFKEISITKPKECTDKSRFARTSVT